MAKKQYLSFVFYIVPVFCFTLLLSACRLEDGASGNPLPKAVQTNLPSPTSNTPAIVSEDRWGVVKANVAVWQSPFAGGEMLERYSYPGLVSWEKRTTDNTWFMRAGGGWIRFEDFVLCNTEASCQPFLPPPFVPTATLNPSEAQAYPCQVGQIKGNNNSKIYHFKGQQYYPATRSNVTCYNSEEEAQKAGFRKAKV